MSVIGAAAERATAGSVACPAQWQRRVALCAGIALLAAGLAVNWKVSQWGDDFGHIYVIGNSLLRSVDVYTATDLAALYGDFLGRPGGVPHGVFYTPSSGAAILPLAMLPIDAAHVVWFVLSVGILLAGSFTFLNLVAPRLDVAYRVLIVGALMCTSAVRWGMYPLQAAPLVFGLLCLFVVALANRRVRSAFVLGAFALCVKFTLGLPFVGVALVQRRWRLATGIVAVCMLVNIVGFVRLGGIDSVKGYEANMAKFDQADQVNYPDFRAPNSMQRLDWPYLLNAISPDLPRSNVVGILLSLIAGAWLVLEWYRSRRVSSDLETTFAFLGPLVCLSLLSVYHHHYDALALLGPAVVYVVQHFRKPAVYRRTLVALFVVPVLIYAGLYEVAVTQDVVNAMFGVGSSAGVKLVGVTVVVVAFGSSLALLRRFLSSRHEMMPLATR